MAFYLHYFLDDFPDALLIGSSQISLVNGLAQLLLPW